MRPRKRYDQSKTDMIGWVGRISLMLLVLSFLVLVAIGVDSISGRSQQGTAFVIDKYFEPKHTEMHYNSSLKVPLPFSVDDKWMVVLQKGENISKSKIPRPIYETIRKGQEIQIVYRLGVVSGKMYVEKVSPNATP